MANYQGVDLDLDLSAVTHIEVRIVAGDVSISAAPASAGPGARVAVTVAHGPDASVDIEDGELRIEHEPERSLSGLLTALHRVQASIVVTAPEGTPLTVRTVSGDVFVAGFVAETSLTTVSGNLTVTAADGELTLRSVSGEIEVDGVDGEVQATTVSGDVTLARTAAEMRVRSVSGLLTIDLDEVAELSCTTVSGDVAVRLPDDADADLMAVSNSGHLDSAFSGPSASQRRMSGQIGSGGPRLALRSTSGDITVLRRQQVSADHREAAHR